MGPLKTLTIIAFYLFIHNNVPYLRWKTIVSVKKKDVIEIKSFPISATILIQKWFTVSYKNWFLSLNDHTIDLPHL